MKTIKIIFGYIFAAIIPAFMVAVMITSFEAKADGVNTRDPLAVPDSPCDREVWRAEGYKELQLPCKPSQYKIPKITLSKETKEKTRQYFADRYDVAKWHRCGGRIYKDVVLNEDGSCTVPTSRIIHVPNGDLDYHNMQGGVNQAVQIPEPTTWLMILMGVVSFCAVRLVRMLK